MTATPRGTYQEKIAKHLIEQLQKRRFEASFAADGATAREEVLAMIPDGAVVFRCGSETMREIGMWDGLAKRPRVQVINPYLPTLSPEEKIALRIKGLAADFMLASCNAVTMDGRLVNLDGTGNRVAAMTFGPKKVILVVGMNKVAESLEAAIQRVKHYAAPLNSIRLNLKTPCVADGRCHDCKSPDRICNMWSVLEGYAFPGRIHVKLVGEALGY